MRNDILIPAGCAAVGIAVGFIGGFIFAKGKYKKLYEKKYDDEIYKLKKEEAMKESDIEGTKPTEEEAKEIAKDFPSDLWTEAFKKEQEKRKEYKNLVRKEGYAPDDKDEKKEIFNVKEFNKKNYEENKSKFEEELELRAEYSGISIDELRDASVRIIDEEDYYENTHDSEPIEVEWSPRDSALRDIEGNILEPEITFGEDWDQILRRIEDRPGEDTWVYDERLDLYYCCCLEDPRNLK